MAKSSSSPMVDSPDAAETLRQYLDGAQPGTRARGEQYYKRGYVVELEQEEARAVIAVVRGELDYEVELRRTRKGWTSWCSCEFAGDCQHVYATGLAWLERLKTSALSGTPQAKPGARPLSFREEWEPRLAEKLGRPLVESEGAFLALLSHVYNQFRQSGVLFSTDLAQLGFPTREAARGWYRAAYDGWWKVAPQDPMQLWQYVAYDIETSGLTVPPFMRPATDTKTIRGAVEKLRRQETIARWRDRFNSLAVAGIPAVEDVPRVGIEPFDLRVRVERDRSAIETRAKPEAPWKPLPQAQLHRLVERGVNLVEFSTSPAVRAFLALCHDQFHRERTVDANVVTHAGRKLLHHALSHPVARGVAVGADGQPLAFAAEPLVWRVSASSESKQDYVVALHRPDGRSLSPAAIHLPGPPDLYLVEGEVLRGPPPLDGSSAVAAIVPHELLEDPQVLLTLRRFGSQLPPEIEERFVTVPLRARFECRLAEVGGTEKLALSLLAIADEPPRRQEWTPRGWRNGTPSKERDRGKRIVLFDAQRAEVAAGFLGAAEVAYDDFLGCWTRRLTKSFADDFLAWRGSLPADVEVEATGELASLLGAPLRARVEYELLAATGQRDWFDLALALRPEDTTLTRPEIALLLRARGKLVRLPGRGWQRLQVELDDVPAAALAAAGLDAESVAEAAAGGERQRLHALQVAQSELLELLPERQAEMLRGRVEALALPEELPVPAGVRADLRPYQHEGFRFLVFLAKNQLGGVLADDMGLGKTLQAIAWLLWLAEQQPAEAPLRVLVVCPKSVVGNWEAETARFAPALEVLRFTPGLTARDLAARGARPLLVVANYTQLRLQAEFFHSQRWHAAILDEGQFIKNPTSKVAQTARELQADHRLVLTGTPIENRLLDLWSLFAFALPGLLGSQAAFKRRYEPDDPLALARLRARVRHFLLRRTKAQVAADLPARVEEDVFVDLEGEQARLYQAELKRARAQLLRVDTPKQLDKERFNILASLMRLRQICCHAALVDGAQRAAPAAKLEALLERVEELRDEGHQVLVFSQFVQMLELIAERLAATGIEYLMLTGQTEDRETLVAEFQAKRHRTVFLLSLKAAGFGLNLTAASYVILFDPWWNPAVEAQAIDRTHRIGQTVPVNAYRLIARGTVEEKIRALQREKAALAGTIVQEESLANVLDLETLKQVLA